MLVRIASRSLAGLFACCVAALFVAPLLIAALIVAPGVATAQTTACAERSGHLTDDDAVAHADGTNFFTSTINLITIRPASELVDGSATAQVSTLVRSHYRHTNVRVSFGLGANPDRMVVVGGDVAVPDNPQVFTLSGLPTLFVHESTGAADIESLLTQQKIVALATGCSPLAQTNVPEEQTEVLAFADTTAATPSRALTPLADVSQTRDWRTPVAAASLLTLTAGVLLIHREKFKEDDGPARQARVLLHASKPSEPVPEIFQTAVRLIDLDDPDAAPRPQEYAPAKTRKIDLEAGNEDSVLRRLASQVANRGSLLATDEFASRIMIEWRGYQRGGKDGAIASLVFPELESIRLRLGNLAAQELFRWVSELVAKLTRPDDIIGLGDDNELTLLMPEVSEDEARQALDEITATIAARTWRVLGERILLTPATGFALISDTDSAPDLIRAVGHARALSMLNLHLAPERWDSSTTELHASSDASTAWATAKAKLRTPCQILMTFVLAWVVPFFFYVGMAAIGLDISFIVYLALVASLVLTGGFILAEGFMAVKQKEPPEIPSTPYPKATALIAAYMPNEAATILETIDAFLAIDYPNDLQIIVAYNTPDELPIEAELDRLAAEHPNFVPVKIVGSRSKAQNVNAALSMANGTFIGMFDADHQPRPDAFTRAWRWIDDGYDVVQGHCLTRNGDECFLAKMIAVEFEGIYSVAHPGRAKMHRFGVFGGSNGFWRTELLHQIRMRGSMLTEDIDSSMRVVERGLKIRSDRDLVSRELATTTFRQIWNQRMRWAQGWFQVSLAHMKMSFRSKELTRRQKLGVFHLLMWREIYPWLSQQLFPLMAFWALRAGGLTKLDWTIPIFLATSVFTFSVGPLQTVFTYRLADPEIKQHKSWFWLYLLFTTPFYTEYKNLIARVAHLKQFMGESEWRVTPRSTGPEPA